MVTLSLKYNPDKRIHEIENESELKHLVRFRCSDEFLRILETAKHTYDLNTSDLIREAVIKLLTQNKES